MSAVIDLMTSTTALRTPRVTAATTVATTATATMTTTSTTPVTDTTTVAMAAAATMTTMSTTPVTDTDLPVETIQVSDTDTITTQTMIQTPILITPTLGTLVSPPTQVISEVVATPQLVTGPMVTPQVVARTLHTPQIVTGSICWGRVLKVTHKFFCDVCNQGFTKKGDLKNHQSNSCLNKGKKKFKCSYAGCTKDFSYEQSLKDHINKVHTGAKPYKCESCGSCGTNNEVVNHHKSYPMRFFSPSLQNLDYDSFNFV